MPVLVTLVRVGSRTHAAERHLVLIFIRVARRGRVRTWGPAGYFDLPVTSLGAASGRGGVVSGPHVPTGVWFPSGTLLDLTPSSS